MSGEASRITVETTLAYELDVATPMIFMVAPQTGASQAIESQQISTEPYCDLLGHTDGSGNLVHRGVAPAGRFEIAITTTAAVAPRADDGSAAPFVPVERLPPAALPFLLPSRYVESDKLADDAERITAGLPAGFAQVAAIVAHVRDRFDYVSGSSPLPTSACELAGRTEAVCRDMAHLGIAYCRAVSIPARMVVGYLDGLVPQDVHAWFEAYCGGRWWTCDPTQPTLDGARLVVAYGRDAADVAINTSFGTGIEVLPPAVRVTASST
ncbi:MAG: transglutaminase family protein [Planctomycetota bacterium]